MLSSPRPLGRQRRLRLIGSKDHIALIISISASLDDHNRALTHLDGLMPNARRYEQKITRSVVNGLSRLMSVGVSRDGSAFRDGVSHGQIQGKR